MELDARVVEDVSSRNSEFHVFKKHPLHHGGSSLPHDPDDRQVDHRHDFPRWLQAAADPARRAETQHIENRPADDRSQRPFRPPLPPIDDPHNQPHAGGCEGDSKDGEGDGHTRQFYPFDAPRFKTRNAATLARAWEMIPANPRSGDRGDKIWTNGWNNERFSATEGPSAAFPPEADIQ